MSDSLDSKTLSTLHRILTDYKSPKQMLKGNNQILKELGYTQYPEIQISFCEGVVFGEIIEILEISFYPTAPPYAAMKTVQKMFLAFCRGEYDI